MSDLHLSEERTNRTYCGEKDDVKLAVLVGDVTCHRCLVIAVLQLKDDLRTAKNLLQTTFDNLLSYAIDYPHIVDKNNI